MKWKVMLIFFMLIFCQNLFSQFTWQRIYTSQIGGDEEAYDICEADSNNYYVGGIAAPFFRYTFVLKINPWGDTLWRRTYFGGEIYTIASVSDGGCIFAGYFGGAFACRIKPNGDTLWVRAFNAINFMDMKKTHDGNYILCGVEYSNDSYNGYVCKIDTSGNTIWERIYPANVSIDFATIEPGIDGGFVVGGVKRDIQGGPRFSYLCKINDTGTVIWERNYLLSIDNYISSIQQLNSGYILTGRSLENVYLQKIKSNGDSIQTNFLSSTNGVSMGPVLSKANDNKYYLAHVNYLSSRIYAVDSNLVINKQLIFELPSPRGISLSSIINVSNSVAGDIICAGWADYYEMSNIDFFVVRIDSSLNAPPPIGNYNFSGNIANSYELFQNYPNPFNPATMIKYVIPKDAVVKIKVYDILGKQVFGLDEFKKAGSYEVRFNGANLASGMYFYSVEASGFKETKKMVLLK